MCKVLLDIPEDKDERMDHQATVYATNNNTETRSIKAV
jgi:hypothetical protein